MLYFQKMQHTITRATFVEIIQPPTLAALLAFLAMGKRDA
jgi:hypothetical protein